MILQISFTEIEIKNICDKMGLETGMTEITHFRSIYHNSLEEYEVDTLCVKLNGKLTPAKGYIELELKNKLIELIS